MRIRSIVTGVVLATLFSTVATAQRVPWRDAATFAVDANGNVTQRGTFLKFEHTHLDTPVSAEVLYLETPLNRSKNNGETVRLPVLRMKTTAESPASPLVYLQGGPGGSAIASQDSFYLAPIIAEALKTRDVVLMDQRGVGRSRPAAIFTIMAPLPEDIFLSEEAALAEFRKRYEAAREHFEKRGPDLSGFTSVEAADDLEALRLALGVEKISLLGFSYGTHLALATLKLHAEHIDRAVLVGTEGLNDTWKLPFTYDEQLDKLTKLVAADPIVGKAMPDMKASWKRILERAAKEPYLVTIEHRGGDIELSIGPFGLQWIVRRDIGDTNDLPGFPRLFHQLENGDVTLLTHFVDRRYGQYGQGIHGMATTTDIASGATAERYAEIDRQARTALFGNSMNFPDYPMRDLWNAPDLGDDFRAPVETDVPTLFISGTLDCQTPPEQAEAARETFSDSAHVVVENAGHESLLPHPEVQAKIIAFLNGEEVADQRVVFDLEFRPIDSE